MFLHKVSLRHIKCFEEITLSFTPPKGGQGGWYVILGENGTGKSTLLQAIALGLAGRERASTLLPNPSGWVPGDVPWGECRLELEPAAETGNPRRGRAEYMINRDPGEFEGLGYVSRSSVLFPGSKTKPSPWLFQHAGFVIAGYGPFRHLPPVSRSSYEKNSVDEPLLNLFYPSPLTDCEGWLQSLDYARQAEKTRPVMWAWYNQVYEAALAVVNQLLPTPVRILDVSPDGVRFTGHGGRTLWLSGLSDGYRTMFGLAIDIIRRCFDHTRKNQYPFSQQDGHWVVDCSGIVLIDEVEAHLHPRWQREIGFFLQQAFPRIQFIVTTHSPFVAQAATYDGIYILRRSRNQPGVEIDDSIDSLQGWRAEQILSSPVFGLETTRDLVTEQRMKEHRRLQAKVHAGLELTPAERRKLDELTISLQNVLPPPYGEMNR